MNDNAQRGVVFHPNNHAAASLDFYTHAFPLNTQSSQWFNWEPQLANKLLCMVGHVACDQCHFNFDLLKRTFKHELE
jgi:hypothetical protein